MLAWLGGGARAMGERARERLKLLASFLNLLGVGAFTVGIYATIVSRSVTTADVAYMVLWGTIGFILHCAASWVLGGLPE